MKKSFIAYLSLVSMIAACAGGKQKDGVPAEPASDETTQSSTADSLSSAGGSMGMPEGADELFDDFFFNFASSLRQQKERTEFPLTVADGEKTREITKRQWKLEPFFMKQDYYTLFFDSPSQMNLANDTSVSNVTVERFYLDKDRVEQFLFSRHSGRWMLHEVRWQPMPHNPNAQFLSFYKKFVDDSLFQYKSLADQIEFSGPDPEDDFSTIDGVITPDFWEAFRPELPATMVYNIVYGMQNPAATQKIMWIRCIANGMEV